MKNRHSIKQLQALAKAPKNKPWALRIQTIVLAKQGWSSEHLVEITWYCRRTIQQWVARYNQAGQATARATARLLCPPWNINVQAQRSARSRSRLSEW